MQRSEASPSMSNIRETQVNFSNKEKLLMILTGNRKGHEIYFGFCNKPWDIGGEDVYSTAEVYKYLSYIFSFNPINNSTGNVIIRSSADDQGRVATRQGHQGNWLISGDIEEEEPETEPNHLTGTRFLIKYIPNKEPQESMRPRDETLQSPMNEDVIHLKFSEIFHRLTKVTETSSGII